MLPSFWRSTPAELEIQASDPTPPYGDKLPAHLIPRDEPRDPKASSGADAKGEAKAAPSKRGENDDKPPRTPRRSDNDTDKPRAPRDKHVTSPTPAPDSSGGILDKVGVSPAVASAPGVRNAPPASAAPGLAAEPTPALPANEPDTRGVSQCAQPGQAGQAAQTAEAQAAEEEGRQAAALMAEFTSGLPSGAGRAHAPPAIKAVVVGKSDPDDFSASARAFAAVDEQDDAYDELAGQLEEEVDEDDLVACAPDEEYESDESDAAEQAAAHWERVVRAAK